MIDRLTQSGATPQRVGTAGMQGLTLFRDTAPAHQSVREEVREAAVGVEVDGQPQFVLIGLIGILVLLWVARQQSEFLQREALGVNLYNLVSIGLTASLFIWLSKILFARFYVPGISPLFAAL